MLVHKTSDIFYVAQSRTVHTDFADGTKVSRFVQVFFAFVSLFLLLNLLHLCHAEHHAEAFVCWTVTSSLDTNKFYLVHEIRLIA